MGLLAETPWWVYFLFIFLVLTGLIATRPRTISFKRLTILPGIFTIWNLFWLEDRIQGHPFLFIYWAVGLFFGSFLGWLTVRSWIIHANREQKRISLPGSWSTLILILIVFAIRYFFVYNYKMHPEEASLLFTPDALISGVITGTFIGRSFKLYRKYIKAS